MSILNNIRNILTTKREKIQRKKEREMKIRREGERERDKKMIKLKKRSR